MPGLRFLWQKTHLWRDPGQPRVFRRVPTLNRCHCFVFCQTGRTSQGGRACQHQASLWKRTELYVRRTGLHFCLGQAKKKKKAHNDQQVARLRMRLTLTITTFGSRAPKIRIRYSSALFSTISRAHRIKLLFCTVDRLSSDVLGLSVIEFTA